MTGEPTVTYRVATVAAFPHGLTCPTCERVIEPGQPFEARPSGVYDTGATCSTLTCVYCEEPS